MKKVHSPQKVSKSSPKETIRPGKVKPQVQRFSLQTNPTKNIVRSKDKH